MKYVILLLTLLILSKFIFHEQEQVSYELVTIQGLKPKDATIKIWAVYYFSGDLCETYTTNIFSRKTIKGGSYTEEIPIKESSNFSEYEAKVNLGNYTDGNNCLVTLTTIKILSKNEFADYGFAGLNISNREDKSYNKIQSYCNATSIKTQLDKVIWGMACDYYTNDNLISKREYTAYTIRTDLSKIPNEKIINYDIIAGDNYRSEPAPDQY